MIVSLGGKVRTFLVLFANIHGKSAIFAHQTTRKLRIIPTPVHVTIAHTTHALTGVTNIEFFVLNVALPSAKKVRYTVKYVWYVSVECHAWRERKMA